MKTRQRDALLIQMGACNPAGIVLSLYEHIGRMQNEEQADTSTICNDPAIRLIVHQLAHITHVGATLPDWEQCMLECAAKEAARIYSEAEKAAGQDAGFDAGEFSGPAHAKAADREVQEVARLACMDVDSVIARAGELGSG